MAQLIFNYGVMGSSKTANALMVCYNYEERGQVALLVKPSIDTRFAANKVVSRIGIERESKSLEELCEKMEEEEIKKYNAIIVDEAQFATKEQIEYLAKIVDEYKIPVLCYGLRADFQNKLFPGSEALFSLADKIIEIKTICWCGKKATCNARFNKNGIIRDGEQVVLGENDSYIGLCREHFNNGDFGPDWN